LLPFQAEANYEIRLEGHRATAEAAWLARVALAESGISPKALMDAEKAGFVDYLANGEHAAVVYLGRDNLANDGRVVNAIAQNGVRKDGPLRDEFAPVLHGNDPTRVVIVPTGDDALAVWTNSDDTSRPTVIVADSPEQLHPRVAQVIAKAQAVDVTRFPKAGLVADRARELSPANEVRETTEEPAREVARQAEVERTRVAAEELTRKNELQRGR